LWNDPAIVARFEALGAERPSWITGAATGTRPVFFLYFQAGAKQMADECFT
jgi:hypothetical protein